LLLLLLFVVVIIVAVAVAILIYIHILISRSNAPVGEWGETKVASNLSFGPKLLPILVKIIRIAPLSFTGTIAAYPQGNGDCPIRNQRSSSTALLNIMGNFDHLRRANQIELGGLALVVNLGGCSHFRSLPLAHLGSLGCALVERRLGPVNHRRAVPRDEPR